MDPYASALDLAAAIRKKQVSSAEITRFYIERIERLNPKLNAFVLKTPELALEQARAADASSEEGRALWGVPASVKDLVSLAGYPMTLGSKAFEDYVLPIDFFSVARLKEEGCPILGKTNLSEFGTRPTTEHGLFGATHNPWRLDHSPGGSSGGAAAAVAAGLCAFAQGSDGGGSVRIPASCCGTVGLKPSRGRVSAGPLLGEHWEGLATDGVIARTVADAALALDAISGHLPGDAYWAETETRFAASARPVRRRLRIGFTVQSATGSSPT
ncbi:MAG: amidase [Candidatus Dormibacterales bacterium]